MNKLDRFVGVKASEQVVKGEPKRLRNAVSMRSLPTFHGDMMLKPGSSLQLISHTFSQMNARGYSD
jgi:hypothetical protein